MESKFKINAEGYNNEVKCSNRIDKMITIVGWLVTLIIFGVFLISPLIGFKLYGGAGISLLGSVCSLLVCIVIKTYKFISRRSLRIDPYRQL